VPADAVPPVEGRSFLARSLRAVATAFSAGALLGVCALLLVLLIGGEWVTPADNSSPPPEQSAIVARGQTPPAKSGDTPVATAPSAVGQDTSRIPAERSAAARGGGMVRAAGVQEASLQPPQPPEPAPAAQNTAAAAPAAESPFSPPPGHRDSTFSTPPAAEARAAPSEIAARPAPRAPEKQADAAPRSTPTSTQAKPRTAPVTSDVNLRAAPDNDADVVTVVPNGKHVRIVECTRWCEVVYGEKQGFIHRRFVSGAGE
jgi:hypothetical protein